MNENINIENEKETLYQLIENDTAREQIIKSIINTTFVTVLQSLIPVITNIITMSIPRFMMMVGIFMDNNVKTLKEQQQIINNFVSSPKYNFNLEDDEFMKLLVEAVQQFKEKK